MLCIFFECFGIECVFVVGQSVIVVDRQEFKLIGGIVVCQYWQVNMLWCCWKIDYLYELRGNIMKLIILVVVLLWVFIVIVYVK